MRLQINDTEVTFPSFPWEVTLGQRIAFQNLYGLDLDAAALSLEEYEGDTDDRSAEAMALLFERMVTRFAFFAGCTPDAAMEHLDTVSLVYFTNLATVFEAPEDLQPLQQFTWNNETWTLPAPELVHGSSMTFGEIIDAKQAVKDRLQEGLWAYLPHLCAIFLRRDGEAYQDAFLYEGSERLALMQQLPLDVAFQVAIWFEEFNQYLQDAFPVFGPSRVKGQSGKASREHFDRWGWVNFLKAIAKTKVFDIPGITLNSIGCARIAPAFDVLLYASEDKEFGEAQFLDYEEKNRNR